MINRRLIRIKIFQSLYGEFNKLPDNSDHFLKKTEKSIMGIKHNMFGVLAYLPELASYMFANHNPKEFKFKPTADDDKLFALLTDSSFVKKLNDSKEFSAYLKKPKIDWSQDQETLFMIYKSFRESQFFAAALDSELTDEAYFEFAKGVYKFLILESVDFELFMEEKNIFWYDEKIPILKSLERLFTAYEETNTIVLPNFLKSIDEDLKMAEEIITNYLHNKEELEAQISNYTPGWDSDRITNVDYILMSMALTEFKYCPMIPVKVTLNEYIEIAKMYSTPKSSKFVNGALDKILQDWKQKGEINKSGRGLIG